MIKTQYIRLDMTPGGTPPVLFCSQYDVGRPLGMVVYNGGEAVDLSTYTCTIEATRTDGTAITAAVTTDGNIGAFSTTATMTNIADRYPAKMVIVDGSGNRVASLAFVMMVTPATMDENAESIEEDRTLYQQYTGTVQTLIAEIRSDLAAEVTRAQAAEASLRSADASIQSSLASETSARQTADQTLTANLASEVSARQTADSNLQSALAAETLSRQTTDTNLQNQINQLVAPTGSAPSAAEIENARIGADGTTYTTLGDAIRGQVSELTDDAKELNRFTAQTIDKTLVSGYYTSDGRFYPDSSGITFTTQDYFAVNKAVPIRFIGQLSTTAKSWCAINYFDKDKKFIVRTVFYGEAARTIASAYLIPPDNAYYARLSYRVNAEWSFDYFYVFDAIPNAIASGLNRENFVLGRLASGELLRDGTNTANRVSTVNKVAFDKAMSISVKTGYAFAVHTFTDSGAFEADSGWITSEYWVPANKEFRLMMRVDPTNDNAVASVDDCVSALQVYDKYGNDTNIIRGGFSSGKIVAHASRAVTPTIKKYEKMVMVRAMTGYQVAIVEIRNDTVFYDYYWRNTWFMPAGAEFRLLIQREDGTAVDLSATCFTITELEKEPSNSNFKCINHRGFIFAPENTLVAFKLSAEAGFRLVETDIMFTADNVPVLLHDETINRTARNLDYSTISDTVRIDAITYQQALGYTFNQGRGWYQEYIPIPTFEEFISFCKWNSLQAYIELKTASNLTDARAEMLVGIVKKYGMLDNVTWVSFNVTLLQKIRALDASCRVGFLDNDDPDYHLEVMAQLGANSFLEVQLDTASSEEIQTYMDNGITVEAWTLSEISDFTTINPYITRLTNNYYHN